MPSSYSVRLRLELQADGENSGTWGQRLNTVIQLIEEATDGYLAKAVTDGVDTVLTATNGVADESRQRVLKLTGALTAQRNVIVPTVEKFYLVWNACTGFGVQVKTAAGTGIVLPVGAKAILFCDGTNVEQIMLLSSFGQTLIDDADQTAALATLGLENPVAISHGGTGQTTAPAAFGALKQDATEAATGVVEIATQAEIETGTDVVRTVTPGRLAPAAMVWTGAHTFKLVDAGATEGPTTTWFRDSASPAANDVMAALRFQGRDSGAGLENYAAIFAEIADPTAASEDGRLRVRTRRAGADSDIQIESGSILMPAATGGLPGSEGRINAAGLQINGVAVPKMKLVNTAITYTMVADDVGGIVRFTAGATTFNVLAVANWIAGQIVTVWNDAASGDVTIDPDLAETLDGQATRLLRPGDRVTLINDGANIRTLRGAYSFSTLFALSGKAGTNTTVAHGLGIRPTDYYATLVCTTAELGYSINDEALMPLVADDFGTGAAEGTACVPDNTNLVLVHGANSPGLVFNKSTQAVAGINGANWSLRIKAEVRFI